jgi:hypothetical protein
MWRGGVFFLFSGGMGETNLKADILVRSKMLESADGGWQCAGNKKRSDKIKLGFVPVCKS